MKHSFDPESNTVIVDLSTIATRFDMTTLIQEWRDYTLSQGGYSEMDEDFVGALSFKHAELFVTVLEEDGGMGWNDLDGTFEVPMNLWMRMGSTPPLDRETLDLVWSDCFQTVANEFYDMIEEGLVLERLLGLG